MVALSKYFYYFLTKICNAYRAASSTCGTETTFIEDNCSSKDCFKGRFADIWHDLSGIMNFTYSIRKISTFGTLRNGSWNGMIGIKRYQRINNIPLSYTYLNSYFDIMC